MGAGNVAAAKAKGEEIYAHSVDILTLPEGTIKVLKDAGIKEVGVLLAMSRAELKVKGIPDKHLGLTAKALRELNLEFGTLSGLVKRAD